MKYLSRIGAGSWAGTARSLTAALLVVGPAASGSEAKPTESPPDLTELSLEELSSLKVSTVYGASKHEQKISEAPSAVSIVTADDVKKYGYRTLGDLLQSVRGFYVTSDRVYSYIGIRGVNRPGDFGGRVLITVNGHRVNDPLFDQAFNGTDFLLDIDLIDHVEIIRGPGSSLYGNNAFFSVVNVVTRKGQDLKGAEMSGVVASYDTYSGRVSYGNRLDNGIDVLLSGTWSSSDGHDELEFPEYAGTGNSTARDLDGSRAPSVWGSISYKDLSLEGGYVDRHKDVPVPVGGAIFGEKPNSQEDKRGFVGVKLEHEFAEDWKVAARVYYDRYVTRSVQPYDGEAFELPGEAVVVKDGAVADWWDGELQVSKNLWERNLVTGGVEFRKDISLERQTEIGGTGEVDMEAGSNDSVGFYLQNELSIRTNLILNAGVRYDHFQSFGDTINPRAALIYSPLAASTFKLIYGQAFRAPNIFEREFFFPGYLPNPDLQPEKIHSYELVWEQGLSKHLRLTTDLFYNQIDDLITQVYDPDLDAFIFRNTDSVDAKGVELELSGQWASGLRGYVNYSFVDATEQSAQTASESLLNSPQHLGKVGFSVPCWRDRIFASLDAQAMSDRRASESSVPGFATLNFTLFSRELIHGLEASVSVYNLLNEHYNDPVAPDLSPITMVRQDGRSFRFKLTYHF